MRIRTAILVSSSFLKVSSLVIAYMLWSMLSNMYHISSTYTVPVIIEHNQQQQFKINQAPNSAIITLRGPRNAIRSLDKKTLAIRLHEKDLIQGSNTISISRAHLGLPTCINVIDCNPANFVIVAQ